MIECGAVRSTAMNLASGRPSYSSPGTAPAGYHHASFMFARSAPTSIAISSPSPSLPGGLVGWVSGPGRNREHSWPFHS
jgi:hypothetical protein